MVEFGAPCCSPAQRSSGARAGNRIAPEPGDEAIRARLTPLRGGWFLMGAADGYPGDGEGPVREVNVAPFSIDSHTATNRDYAAFVEATGHRTEAERRGISFVFGGHLPDDFPPTRAVATAPWWREVEGADWRHPHGPHSSIVDRLDHPVVHVSHDDATRFCIWAGVRLPREAEWEYAARGGLVQRIFPWGDELEPDGEHRMNVFQGTFPAHDSADDGWAGTCPVDSFAPNGYGLHNMTGNVWEWCADWFVEGALRAIRGGSYLCHASYCRRYRVAARSGNSPDATTGNMGFRVVATG